MQMAPVLHGLHQNCRLRHEFLLILVGVPDDADFEVLRFVALSRYMALGHYVAIIRFKVRIDNLSNCVQP